uniref:molybdopterin biosynthesis protein n=1 Tax=Catenella fusiformis TaxID=3024791 RepID=UPI0027DA0A6F|nr:molybdopterin biosynthesis protein [Catenella fusiformis]WCH57604.1 molybdopterin biosynthesis protein [Catenella fusiformis]
MLNPKLNNFELSDEEYKKYGRQLILNSIGTQGQKRLQESKILVIGAGGLGCPALLYLASSGIGCLGIIDNDIISISNLHRQILYTVYDTSKLKITSAKQKLKQINTKCQINTYSYKLTKGNAYKLIKKYDIVLDASDNFYTRYLIDYTCYQLHKVHIYGAIQGFKGHMSVFNYKSGPKYSDLYPKYLKLQENSCQNTGVLGIITGIIGILQATEAIKIIIGTGKILSGYLLIYDSLEISLKTIKIRPLKTKEKIQFDCKQLFLESTDITDLSELKKNQKISLIDVRQKKEFTENHILTAINIPLKDIYTKKNINRIQQIATHATIILYCSNNSRSIIASKILTQNKIHHYRLNNGLYTQKKQIN